MIVDKLIIASVIASFSTAVLFSYNLFSKSFDAAREQSRNFSSFAIKSKETVTTATAEVEVALSGLFYVFKSPADREIAFKMYSQLAQLNAAINVLAGSKAGFDLSSKKSAFPKSVEYAKSINMQLRKLATFYDQKSNRLLNLPDLKVELDKIDGDESLFIIAFNNELGQALAVEFEQFYNAYYAAVPWYARPLILFVLCLASLLLCIATLFVLPSKPVSMASDLS